MRFSERLGYKPVREQLQIESVDEELKNSLWSVYLLGFLDILPNSSAEPGLVRFAKSLWFKFFKKPIDELPISDYDVMNRKWLIGYLKSFFFAPERMWYDYYDLIEFSIPFQPLLIPRVNLVLEREKSAFRIVDDLFVKMTSEVEISGIEDALKSTGKFAPVYTHLNEALRMLSDRVEPDYRNSVKESTSALEAMCKIFVNDPKATLGKALSKLEKEKGIHPALKASYSSLYGYTSDSSGIRHSLKETDTKIDFPLAKLMLVTATSFINYLISQEEGLR